MNGARDQARPDFICIGAQKCGTTSLGKYLGSHPDIYMPPEKELNFWSDPDAAAKGSQGYLREFFNYAKPEQVWGEASVGYLHTPGTAARILDGVGDVKIIAILRDPVERALSHFRMSSRRGLVGASFEEAVAGQLQTSATQDETVDVDRDFLQLGEYSRQLQEYFDLFPHESIQVLFLEDLSRDPASVVATLFKWLGVDDSFEVPILGKRFNVGGSARVEGMQERAWYRFGRRFAHILLPSQVRRTLGFWLDTEWNVERHAPAPIADPFLEQLVGYYAPEIDALETLTGQSVPWARWRETSATTGKQ